MSTGRPDYVLATDIVAQSIGNFAIDIVAASIGNLQIDIAAASLGNLNIDLAESSIGNLAIDIAASSIGNLNIDISEVSVGNLAIDIAASSIGNLNIDISEVSVGDLDVDIVASSIGNLSIDINAQTIGNLNIDISAQTVDRMYILPQAPTGATTIYKSNIAQDSTVILHTVTAGKTFYLTYANLTAFCKGTAGYASLLVRNTGDVIQYYLGRMYLYAPYQDPSLDESEQVIANAIPITVNPALAIPAGWDIVMYSANIKIYAAAAAAGWEE